MSVPPAFEHIALDHADGVTVLTLSRPAVLNSLHQAMAEEIQSALSGFAADPAQRALLLTGSGRGFCAGQDLSSLTTADGTLDTDLGRIVRTCYNPIIAALRTVEKPVVAAVNGIAAGAGANLALACDIVLASEAAVFVQSFAKVGLVPDSGGTFILPRLVGWARASAMMLLAEKVDAATAQAIGMIYRVVPADRLLPEAMTLARHLACQPTMGLGLTKRALNASSGNDLGAQLAMEAELQGLAGATADYREGIAAFLAKRPPRYAGR